MFIFSLLLINSSSDFDGVRFASPLALSPHSVKPRRSFAPDASTPVCGQGLITVYKFSADWFTWGRKRFKNFDDTYTLTSEDRKHREYDQYFVEFETFVGIKIDVSILPTQFVRGLFGFGSPEVKKQEMFYGDFFDENIFAAPIVKFLIPVERVRQAIQTVTKIDFEMIRDKKIELLYSNKNKNIETSCGVMKKNNKTYVETVLSYAGIVPKVCSASEEDTDDDDFDFEAEIKLFNYKNNYKYMQDNTDKKGGFCDF